MKTLKGTQNWVSNFKAVSDKMFGDFLSLGSHLLCSFGSCSGRLTSYANRGRVEDIFLRYIDQHDNSEGPVNKEEPLYQNLKHLKYEAEMLDKIGSLEALERELHEVNQQKFEAADKMRCYHQDVTSIHSIHEADRHQQFIMDAIQRIENLKKEKLLEIEASSSNSNNVKMPAVEVKDSDLTTEEAVNSKRKRNLSAADHKEEPRSPTGPHLTLSYILRQKNWNLGNAEGASSSKGRMP